METHKNWTHKNCFMVGEGLSNAKFSIKLNFRCFSGLGGRGIEVTLGGLAPLYLYIVCFPLISSSFASFGPRRAGGYKDPVTIRYN